MVHKAHPKHVSTVGIARAGGMQLVVTRGVEDPVRGGCLMGAVAQAVGRVVDMPDIQYASEEAAKRMMASATSGSPVTSPTGAQAHAPGVRVAPLSAKLVVWTDSDSAGCGDAQEHL